jgi:hypothetical protein
MLGRGEEWWRAKAKELNEKLLNANKNYDAANTAWKAKEKELEQSKLKSTNFQRKLKSEVKTLEEKAKELQTEAATLMRIVMASLGTQTNTDNAAFCNQFAWFLATSEDLNFRDGSTAVEFAEKGVPYDAAYFETADPPLEASPQVRIAQAGHAVEHERHVNELPELLAVNHQNLDRIERDLADLKAGKTIGPQDLKGLRAFAEMTGRRFWRGVLLYTGKEVIPFGPNLHAVPVNFLWSEPKMVLSRF